MLIFIFWFLLFYMLLLNYSLLVVLVFFQVFLELLALFEILAVATNCFNFQLLALKGMKDCEIPGTLELVLIDFPSLNKHRVNFEHTKVLLWVSTCEETIFGLKETVDGWTSTQRNIKWFEIVLVHQDIDIFVVSPLIDMSSPDEKRS